MTTNVKLLAIKAAIFDMGLKFNQEPSDAKITAYAKDLMDYSPEQINFAFRQIINSGTAFFPSLAEILKHLKPAQEVHDKAPQIAAEMLQALRWYGPHDEVNMLKNISPEAKATFERLGNTQDIRNSENTDTVRAQLERLARSVMQSKQVEAKNEQLQKIGIVLPFQRIEFSPEPA